MWPLPVSISLVEFFSDKDKNTGAMTVIHVINTDPTVKVGNMHSDAFPVQPEATDFD